MPQLLLRFLLAAPIALLVGAPPSALAQEAVAPHAEPPRMSQLQSFQQFAGIFNLGQGAVRILMIVSPTCPECVTGLEEMYAMMGSLTGKRLRAYIVFLPMLENDDGATALLACARYDDPRAVCFWDPSGIVGEAYKSVVGLDTPACDVYLLYDTDGRISEDSLEPAWWMHQHSEIVGPAFDMEAFSSKAGAMLAGVEAKVREQLGE